MMSQASGPTPSLALSTERAERVGRYVSASKSTNTQRMYRAQWSQFESYCLKHGYQALPAQPAAVADYITHLADSGRKVSTIQQALAAIGYVHETSKHTNPAKSTEAKETMKGIRRKVGVASSPKTALTPDELRQIVASCSDDLRGIRNRALLLMGFAGAFRRSELVALAMSDITIRRDGSGDVMSIRIQRSKGDQEGEGLYKTIEGLADKSICPITAWRAWLGAAGIVSGAAFRGVDRWGNVKPHGMDGREVARVVQGTTKAAGLDSAQFAGHSLRSGFVTAAANAGANDSDIMEQTGHKNSATLRRYKQLAGLGARRAMRAVFADR